MDTIDVIYSEYISKDGTVSEYLALELNGTLVKGTFDAYTFISSGELKKSELELLTCSCGVAGCAGIFYGTQVKRRRYTTEWRDIDCGFPKRFYNFDNNDYNEAIAKTLRLLRNMAECREAAGKVWEDYDYDSDYRFHSVAELESQLAYNKEWVHNYCVR